MMEMGELFEWEIMLYSSDAGVACLWSYRYGGWYVKSTCARPNILFGRMPNTSRLHCMEKLYRLNVPSMIYGTWKRKRFLVEKSTQKTEALFFETMFLDFADNYEKKGLFEILQEKMEVPRFKRFFKNSKLNRLVKIFQETIRLLACHHRLLTSGVSWDIDHQYKTPNQFQAFCFALRYRIQYFDKYWLLRCYISQLPTESETSNTSRLALQLNEHDFNFGDSQLEQKQESVCFTYNNRSLKEFVRHLVAIIFMSFLVIFFQLSSFHLIFGLIIIQGIICLWLRWKSVFTDHFCIMIGSLHENDLLADTNAFPKTRHELLLISEHALQFVSKLIGSKLSIATPITFL